ncbi:MAG: class I SAM-dependent methyltransferase [Acidimicrobiales bacterium]|nr:class I SAM-dependent methyltransferase [Acidimicrobiales bacterium]
MTLHDPRTPDADRPLDTVDLGPGVGADVDRRLIGDVTGRRVLDLGCGQGHTAVGLARRGARVIAVDEDVAQLAATRALAAREEVVVECHQAKPAELAFLPGDHVDLALAITTLSWVQDLNRVFRQVHRVIGPNGHFVLSVPHAATLCADPNDPARTVARWDAPDPIGDRWAHTVEDVATALGRANFAVDTILERHHGALLPATLVVRARKLGV